MPAKLVGRLTAKLVDRLTAKLLDPLNAKLMNRLTAKLVERLAVKLAVVNLDKFHLTKFRSDTVFFVLVFSWPSVNDAISCSVNLTNLLLAIFIQAMFGSICKTPTNFGGKLPKLRHR